MRDKPFPVPGLQPQGGALTTNSAAFGMGRLLGQDFGPYGRRTPGLVGTATEPSASGTKYYVGDSGNDGNSGTATDDAFRTFAPVSEGGTSEATSGDVIVILGEGVTLSNTADALSIANSGVTVCGEGGTFPTVTVTYTGETDVMFTSADTEFRGFHIDGPGGGDAWYGIRINDAYTGQTLPLTVSEAKNGGYLYNVKVTHMGNSGILLGNGAGGVIEHCHTAYNYGPAPTDGVGGSAADGIQVTSAPAASDSHLGGYILDSLINHNSDGGIGGARLRGLVIRRCLVYGNGYREDGSTTGIAVPGQGIKLGTNAGGFDIGGSAVERTVSAGNGAAGFAAGGCNLPVDYLYCTGWRNARKDGSGAAPDVSYQNDFELREGSDGGPSGFALQDSRVAGCIAEQGVYTSLQSGSIDSTNITTCNFDASNAFDIDFAAIPWISRTLDSAAYPANENTVVRIDTRETEASLPTLIDAGDASYQPTPASDYHGYTDVVAFADDAPDLGAFEASDTGSGETSDDIDTYGVAQYGADAYGS